MDQQEAALAFLRGAGAEEGGELAARMAEAVLAREEVQLAQAILSGDPTWAAKAVRLAGLVLGGALETASRKAGSGRA